MKTVLVTGGAGFIGSNFTRLALAERPEWRIVVLDALTYAGNIENLDGLSEKYGERFKFIKGDVADPAAVNGLFGREGIGSVVHFAAESHVDRSILGPMEFVRTNVLGTATLLDEAVRVWAGGGGRFLQVSTDEVYGALGEEGYFTEESPLSPSSPYSASKAAADHLVLSFQRTFGLDAVVTRCCNNYGPYQFPEKLIPLMIHRALGDGPFPVYGEGKNIRDWIHVDDHCRGLLLVLENGRSGEVYNLGSRCEMRNLDLLKTLLAEVSSVVGSDLAGLKSRITFVKDRPGHDWRYAIDPKKAETELGYRPQIQFAEGLRSTVLWYIQNRGWTERIASGEYLDFVKKQYG